MHTCVGLCPAWTHACRRGLERQIHPKSKRCNARTPAHSPVSLSPPTALLRDLALASAKLSFQGHGPHPGPRGGPFQQMSHSSSPGISKLRSPPHPDRSGLTGKRRESLSLAAGSFSEMWMEWVYLGSQGRSPGNRCPETPGTSWFSAYSMANLLPFSRTYLERFSGLGEDFYFLKKYFPNNLGACVCAHV